MNAWRALTALTVLAVVGFAVGTLFGVLHDGSDVVIAWIEALAP